MLGGDADVFLIHVEFRDRRLGIDLNRMGAGTCRQECRGRKETESSELCCIHLVSVLRT